MSEPTYKLATRRFILIFWVKTIQELYKHRNESKKSPVEAFGHLEKHIFYFLN